MQVFTKALGAPDAVQLTHAPEDCGAVNASARYQFGNMIL
jgi:hypothetical protein